MMVEAIGVALLDTLPDGTHPDYVMAVDPGVSCGWVLAVQRADKKLVVVASGMLDRESMLTALRNIRHRLRHFVLEEPAARGSVFMQVLVGQILEILHPAARTDRMNLYLVGPGIWKQYPKRKITEEMRAMFDGDIPSNPHTRDAAGMLAWWRLGGGS